MCDLGVVVDKLKVEKDEILVLKFPTRLSSGERESLVEHWKRESPGIRALILENGVNITKLTVPAIPPLGPRPTLPERSTKDR